MSALRCPAKGPHRSAPQTSSTSGWQGGIVRSPMMMNPLRAQIRMFSLEPSDREVASHRRAIEASRMLVLEEPEIRRVTNNR